MSPDDYRNKDGELSRKHGNTLIGTLRSHSSLCWSVSYIFLSRFEGSDAGGESSRSPRRKRRQIFPSGTASTLATKKLRKDWSVNFWGGVWNPQGT
jgi:hypothetical protein